MLCDENNKGVNLAHLNFHLCVWCGKTRTGAMKPKHLNE